MQFIMTLCVILSIYTCIHMYSVASYVHVVRSTYWYAFIPYGLKFLCECVNDIQYLWPPCIGVCVKEVPWNWFKGCWELLDYTGFQQEQSSEVRDAQLQVS